MNSINKLFDYKRASYVVAAFAVLLATALPSLAFAAQVTERSIALSSSAVSAPLTKYTINFKAVTLAGAFVIDFCDSPAIGTVCNAPAGMNALGADSDTPAFTAVTGSANKIVVTDAISAGATVTGEITGITNPSDSGVFYARIITFDNVTSANAYDSSTVSALTNPGANAKDQGGVAMSITPTFGVSGSVLESLIFCTSGEAFEPEGCAGDTTPPNVILGDEGVLGSVVSDGTVYSQISTNAATGAVVNLKSSAVGCGGLMLAGATGDAACGIKPVTGAAAAIANDDSKFGLRFGTIENGTGTVGTSYGYATGANYFMDYDDDGTENEGVTSTYGDPIYDTSELPTSASMVPLIFGANISNDTPAGSYSATLNLIATGKF